MAYPVEQNMHSLIELLSLSRQPQSVSSPAGFRPKLNLGAVSLIALLGAFSTSAAIAADPVPGEGDWAGSKTMPAQLGSGSSAKARLAGSGGATRAISVGEVSSVKMSQEITGVAKPGVPLKTGFPREIAVTQTNADTASQLDWQPTASGGLVARLQVTSSGAHGIRLGLLVARLPESAILRVYAPDSDSAEEVSAATVLSLLSKNLASGDNSDNGRTYWAPLVLGDTLVLEVELPAGVSADDVQLAIPTLSHLVKAPTEKSFDAMTIRAVGDSASCNLDVTCYPEWSGTANAVAKMSFVEHGASYECSGTLMADNVSGSYIPYFLSANHCISDQTTASTLNTIWFYRSSVCEIGRASCRERV